MNTQSQNKNAPHFASVLPALSLLTTVFFANFLVRTLFGPLLIPISEHLGQSLAHSANLLVCLTAGYSMSVLCAGFLSCRLGHKKTIVFSTAVIGIALLGLSASTTFWGFCLWTFLMGAAAGLYMPSGVVTITEITPPAYWGQAFAVHEMAPNLSFVVAPFIAEAFMNTSGYPSLFLTLGISCLGLALLYTLRGPATRRTGMAPVLGNIRVIVSLPAFWITVLLFVLAVSVSTGIYNLLPALLVREKGLSREEASFILGATRIMPVFVLPATGWIIRRMGYRGTMALCLLGASLSTVLCGYGPLWWTIAMLTLQPLFVVCFFPVGFAVLSLVCPKATNDLSVSLTIMCTSLFGAGLIPAGLAWCGEFFGFALSFALFGAALFFLMLMTILRLRIPASSPS
ncbi:MAG: MFS transporter [Desulfovibrionales bacterium]|nr:MFS transporter [Desulfovibrionales bacterium]